MPAAQVRKEPLLGFGGQAREHGADFNLHGLAVAVQVAATVEIVFVNHGPPAQPLRTEHEVKRLADRGLANVVATDQESMPGKIHDAFRDPPEIPRQKSP